jgi:hypothetical protein
MTTRLRVIYARSASAAALLELLDAQYPIPDPRPRSENCNTFYRRPSVKRSRDKSALTGA